MNATTQRSSRQRNPSQHRFALLLSALLLTAAGCQPTPAKNHKPTMTIEALPPGKTLTADEAVLSDPCAIQLHDISGALLMYYAVHNQLPPKLEDVRSVADIDTELKFTCPLTHQPYAYTPTGLIRPGSDKRIIVYDSTPAHAGKRWCILMTVQSRPGAAQTVEVIAVPESEFLRYVPTGN